MDIHTGDEPPSFSEIANKIVSPGRLYYTQEEMAKIYTDWANHYLERSPRHKRLILDLQQDITDGVLLADIIEAVTNERLRDIKTKPKHVAQMLENINLCLKCIENLGVNTEGLKAEDIREGNLRAILGLFFSLSRYKQQKKSGLALIPHSGQSLLTPPCKAPSFPAQQQNEMMMSKLPSPFNKSSSNSNRNSTGTIPQSLVIGNSGAPPNRRSLTGAQKDKVFQSPPVSTSGIPAPRSAQNTRSVSPGTASSPHSLIPLPSASKLPSSVDKGNRQNRSNSSISSGISAVSSSTNKVTSSTWSAASPPNPNCPNPNNGAGLTNNMGKSSMFGFGFFQKNKPDKTSTRTTTTAPKQPLPSSDRNSSGSSGFSSGKSETSDSSVTGSENRLSSPLFSPEQQRPHPKETIYENTTTSSNSPKLAIKALAKKTFTKSPGNNKASPALLRIEPRDAESGPTLIGKLPTPQLSADNRKPSKISNVALKPEVRHREPISTVIEEDPSSSSSSSQSKPDSRKPSFIIPSATNGSLRSSGPTPTVSSGIPKPSSATKGKQRLSFPPRDIPPTTTTAEPGSKTEPATAFKTTNPSSENKPTEVVPSIEVVLPLESNGNNIDNTSNLHLANIISVTAPLTTQSVRSTSTNSSNIKALPNGTLAECEESPLGQDSSSSGTAAAAQQIETSESIWKLGGGGESHVESTFDSVSDKIATTKSTCPQQLLRSESESTASETTDSMESVLMMKPMPPLSSRSISVNARGIVAASVSPPKQPSSNDANTSESTSSDGSQFKKPVSSHSSLRAAKPDGRQLMTNSSLSMIKSNVAANSNDYNAGYLSDGDVLRSSSLVPQLRLADSDVMNGYISEGSGGSSCGSKRFHGRQKQKMPIVTEQFQRESRLGRPYNENGINGLDLDETPGNGVAMGKENGGFDRNVHPSSSNFERSFPHSSRTQHQNYSVADSQLYDRLPSSRDMFNNPHSSPQPSVKAMPLLRGTPGALSQATRVEDGTRRPRPAPVTPPPRDPETTLSAPNHASSHGYSPSTGLTNVDNYLSIYASPVRKPRQPINDVFAGRSDRNPGDLFAAPARTTNLSSASGSCGMGNTNNSFADGCNSAKPNTLERRTKLKVSGSTQTSPQELLQRQPLSSATGNNPYSTNSLNRNVNRQAMENGYSPHDALMTGNPPRSRSVVQNHVELSLAPPTMESSHCPLSPKVNKTSPSRFSMPNPSQELSVMTVERYDPDLVGNSPVAALPPKSNRQSRISNGLYEKLPEFDRSQRSSAGQHGIYSKAAVVMPEQHLYRENGSSGSGGMWDRAAHNGGSLKSDQRGYPLSYSVNTHGQYHFDESDNCSTASYPLNGSSARSSVPGSPMLTYSLPRHGQSNGNGSNMRNGARIMSPYVGSPLAKMRPKNDETNGSAGSLASSSSMYSSPEDEIRKLRRELELARERAVSLENELSTSVKKTHVVSAFENTLYNMANRVEMLTTSDQRKNGELSDLRRSIGIRQEGAEAGLVSQTSPGLVRRHTFNSSKEAASENAEPTRGLFRQLSTDSVASLNSEVSNGSQQMDEENKKKKKKNWIQSKECEKVTSQLRSSFSRAFSRNRGKNKPDSTSDAEESRHLPRDLSTSVPNSPLLQASRLTSNGHRNERKSSLKPANSFSALDCMEEQEEIALVEDLQRKLRDNEMMLNDFRLEALHSAQQMDQFKESIARMKNEIESLRQDNLQLRKQAVANLKRRSLSSERKSPRDGGARSTPSESGIGDDESPTFDARHIPVKVVIAEEDDATDKAGEELSVGTIKITPMLRWDQLDKAVRQVFKEYVARLDLPVNLGVTTESIACYHLGNALRNRDDLPTLESTPIDYLKSDDEKIRIVLKGSRDHAVDTIAFETLIPKSFFQRYVSLISEHKRVIICGPSGTGKSFLARKIAQHLVLRSGRTNTVGAIDSRTVDQKSSKDLRQYLMQIAEQCESSYGTNVPSVIIIDNLHHVGSLGEVFNGFLSVKHHRCPYIIGTMNASSSSQNLQLHHNFRWILSVNHMEPVNGFLGRYLRRKILEHEMAAGICDSALTKIIDWIPRAWQNLNTFLEKHSSSDMTVGPRLFLECPMNVRESQDWFTLLWNYSLVPYILEAVKEGLQLYGRCPDWEDPTDWIVQTYPWPALDNDEDREMNKLTHLRPEDVGFDAFSVNRETRCTALPFVEDAESDPVSNMLLEMQKAAGVSSHQNSEDELKAFRLANRSSTDEGFM